LAFFFLRVFADPGGGGDAWHESNIHDSKIHYITTNSRSLFSLSSNEEITHLPVLSNSKHFHGDNAPEATH